MVRVKVKVRASVNAVMPVRLVLLMCCFISPMPIPLLLRSEKGKK